MQLKRYLDRIGYRGAIGADFHVLAALQKTHVCSVPFENIDVQLGRSVTTDIAAAYDKIVVKGRGGWCYEQNGLFGWALSEIGFDVTRLAASVMRQERGEISAANHLCLLVRFPESDRRHIVDVGFGGSLIRPIPLDEAEHTHAPFRLGLRKLEDDYWQFWEDVGRGEFSFDFQARPADEMALQDKCTYLQKDPSSGFVLNLVVQRRQPEEHKTLRGRIFSIAAADGIQTRVINSADGIVTTLADHFAIDMPEVADLWPRIEARHEEILRERAPADTYEIRSRPND